MSLGLRQSIAFFLMATLYGIFASPAYSDPDYKRALKRTQYLLNATSPTDDHTVPGPPQEMLTTKRSAIF